MPKNRKEYNQRWYAKNKEKVLKGVKENRLRLKNKIRQYKIDHGCVDCGYNKHHAALDFDHIGVKNFHLSQAHIRAYSWDKILKEIEQCEIRCSNCHRVKTHESTLS